MNHQSFLNSLSPVLEKKLSGEYREKKRHKKNPLEAGFDSKGFTASRHACFQVRPFLV